MNRKLFAFGILAVLALGCSDDSSDNNGATCNNGVLEGNEVCDGSFFAEGMRVCPEGYELKAGMTTASIMCTATCTVNTSAACVPVAAPACGNGRLDMGEVCDGALFASGKQVCPEGYQFKSGKTAKDITCDASCQVVTDGVCEVPATCGNNALDEGEACDGTVFADGKQVCPEGYQLKSGKTAQDITCNACQVVTNEACELAEQTAVCGNELLDAGEACDGTLFASGKQICPEGYQFKIGKSVQDITCNACQVVTDDACEPEGTQETVISCDGNTLKTCYGDNPDNCTSVDCTKDGKICATVEGVSACIDSVTEEATCENGILTYCLYEHGNPEPLCETTVCADDGLVCGKDDKGQTACVEEVCQAADADKAECLGNVLRICMLNNDADATGFWMTENCSDDKDGKTICDASKSACVLPAAEDACGNGILDNGEVCDPRATPMFPTWKNVTCNYYAGSNGTKIYVSGAPTCTDKCKIDISGCVEATETDFNELYKWTFTSMQDITDITKQNNDSKAGAIKMDGVFGSGMSKYENGGWSLGNWGNAFGKSIVFSAGASTKDGIRVTMDVKRTNANNSPKTINVRLYDGGSSIATGTAISLSGTDKNTVNFDFVLNASYQDLRAAFTAYDAKTDAHIVINNIAIKEADAL